MAVLKPFDMDGTSPQTVGGQYYVKDLSSGKELYYIRFPQSDFYSLTASRDWAYQIIDDGRILQLAVGNFVVSSVNRLDDRNILYYFLGRDFSIKEVTISDSYKMKVLELTGESIDELSVERKLKRLLYYDGEKWVKEPTMTKYWRERLGK